MLMWGAITIKIPSHVIFWVVWDLSSLKPYCSFCIEVSLVSIYLDTMNEMNTLITDVTVTYFE